MNIIITDRLEIRRFLEKDTERYVSIMTNPDVYRYLGSGSGVSEEGVVKLMDHFESIFEQGYGVFAVIEKASGEVIGHCGIRPIPDGRIELLYAYCPSAWGKGYATEAGKAVLAYGKENFNLNEIIAMSYPQNPGSIGVIKKLGFEPIGQEEHFGNMLEVYVLQA